MNGFMMCVLLAATGQVADDAERDYGWQINPDDGKLEYIVQLSPQKANYMVSAAKEQESEVPSEVAARLSRVVVRIGTEPLVKLPLEEVRKLPVVNNAVLANIEATAGPGRYSQLENAPRGDIRNVAGDSSPPSLATGPRTLPEAPGASLADHASQLGSNLSDALKSDISDAISTRGAEAYRQAESLLAQNLTQNPASSSFLSDSRGAGTGAGNHKFSSTATQPAMPLSGSTSTGSPSTGLPGAPSGIVGPMPPAANYQTSPAHNHAAGDGYHNDGTAAAPPMNSMVGSNSGNALNGGSLNGGFNNAYPAGTVSPPGANMAGNTGANAGPPYNNSTGGFAGGTTPVYSQPSGYNNTPPGYGMTPLNGGTSGAGNIAGGKFGGLPPGASTQNPYGQYATVGTGNGVGGYQYGTSPPAYGQGSNLQPSPYTGPSSGHVPDPLSLPSGYSQTTRIADSRPPITVPSTGSGKSKVSDPSGNDVGKGRPSERAADEEVAGTYANDRSGMYNVLPVMFVLSLVVNFYLGMLIRKLLTRYRSLLSSVRSQAV